MKIVITKMDGRRWCSAKGWVDMHAVKNTHNDLLSVDAYIDHQVRRGIFLEEASTPECDPRVLRAYYKMVRDEYPEDAEAFVTLLSGKYGFTCDPIEGERAGLNWACSMPLVDICIGVTGEEFMHDLPSLNCDDVILTDTFSFTGGFGDLSDPHPRIIRMHSPVAKIDMGFEPYLETLTSERRKKCRRMTSDFEKTPLRFELSRDPLTRAELDFARGNLERKWGEDSGYAYRQTLWSAAVQSIRPQQVLIMRVYDSNTLVFIQTLIIKDKRVICQSIIKNEDVFFSGLAAMTDFECIRKLCGRYNVFDPSCRTGLDDPESIGVAKRATVNMNCIKPLFVINHDANTHTIQGKEA